MMLLLLGLLLSQTFAVFAANPVAVQTFFVPMPEDQVRTSLLNIYSLTGATLHGVVGLSVTSSGTIIYYDQWENGYESDITNPSNLYSAGNIGGTQIWGDGNTSNGNACPLVQPASLCSNDVLTAGAVLVLENDITIPRNPATILYDGRDKIGSSKVVAMTKSAWALAPGTVLADAIEVVDTTRWGTDFRLPIGEDLNTTSASMFEYVSLMVMAANDNTQVQIDTDGNGTVDLTQTLSQGQSYQVSSATVGDITSNARITSTKAVQVDLLTGDIGSTYESRWYNIPPLSQLGSSYYTPVGTTSATYPATVWLYNTSQTTAITINYETKAGTGNFSIPAKGTYRFAMPSLSGAHFYTPNGATFIAVGAMDSSTATASQTYDWGYTLVPDSSLTTALAVGWAPGTTDLSGNGSPVWITAVKPTTIYIDYDGNPATGTSTAPNGAKYDISYPLSAFESKQIYDPDKNQTGMRIYTIDGVTITGAWGEDPSKASAGNPYMDVGYTIPPLPAPVVEKSATLLIDNNSNGKADPSDTLAYTITVKNLGVVTLFNTVVSDTAPSNTTYVTNTTKLNSGSISDNVAPASAFPLDEGGINIGNLIVGGKAEMTYQMKANAFPPTYTSLINMVTITIGSDVYTAQSVTPVNLGTISQCTLDFVNSGGTAVATYLENGTLYLKVNDADQNKNISSSEIVTVDLQNPTTGDRETINLTETGVNTGIFTGSISSSVTSGAAIGDGTLKASAGDTLNASYTDPVYGDSCTDSASVTLPSQTKVLYLSDPNQALDRLDPVATVDTSTMSTTLLGGSGGAGIITVVGSAAFTTTAQTASSKSFSYDSGSTGTNRILMVGISYRDNDGESVSTVTYAGQSMNPVGGAGYSTGGTPDGHIYIYSLLNPPTGSNTLAVTWNSALNQGAVIGAITYANVNQTVSTGSFITNSNTSATPVITVTSASNELVFGVVGGRTSSDYTAAGGGTLLWNARPFSGQTSGSGQSKAGASPNVTLSWTGSNSEWVAGGVSLKPAAATGVTSATFTQTLPMASNLVMPAGGLITVTQYISVTSGTPAAPVEMTATLKIGSSSFATLTTPALTSLGGGIYKLVWSGALASNTTVSTGQQVVLNVVTSEPGVNFYILYDSSTYPSQIQLPTTTVIDITSFGIYDAPYPGGTLLTGGSNGQTVYVRATVSDPFGATDITSATVALTDPTNVTTTVNLTSTYVVSSTGSSKTYEYAWNTSGVQGGYTVRITAYEGYEGITDSASTPFNLNFQDTGTPSKSEFTNGDNGPATNSYTPNSQICVRVTDIDQNTNPGLIETITAVISSSSGDSETVTLQETGPDTGVFTKCIPSNTTTNSAGTLLAPAGSTLTVRYVDPNDATDVSSATATVSSPSPALSLSKLSVDPSDGIAVVGETVRFDVVASNPGPTTLNTVVVTDTFPNSCLSYQSASLAPSTIVTQTLRWNNIGPITSGSSKSISLYFLVTAACSPATNSATASAIDANSLPVSTSPATATVATTRPGLSVSKTLLTPISGTAQLGDAVSFRITLTNTGSVTITNLPLSDNYSAGCLAYGSSSPAADNAASGVALWNNLGPLTPGSSKQIDVNFTVVGGCAPTTNFADVSAAVDQNGDAVPAAQGSANVTTVGGTISGAVYDDLNGNGVHDPGEPGIAGVLITLSNGTTATTSASGLYTITNLSVGTYTITETDPSGYTSTGDTQGANDNTISVTLNNSGVNGNDFLDTKPVTITGHVYNDLNGNGSFNGGEPGISSVVITLSTGITAATDANGVYTFTNVLPGTYTLTETNPSGYTSTGDVQGTNDDRITLTVTSGSNVTGQDFFDAQFANITGAVYDDLNGNGIHDPGEPGIPGVLITLSNGAVITTNSSGLYTLTVPVGSYTITETNPSGYTSTGDTQGANDNSISVTVGTGGSSSNNFLDAKPVTITGHVYNDLNGNGAFNSGEPGISSVVITLSTGITAATDANGVYTFTNVMPGTYTLTETNRSGYTSTGDVQGTNDDRIIVTVISGSNVTGQDFFDTQFANLTGGVYDDLNGNGVRDSGEPGISGVLITLSNGNTATTDASGLYTLTVPVGTYTMTETNPSGYTSTGDTQGANDDTITLTIGTGGSSSNNFVDARPVTITGHVYNDLNGNGSFNIGEPGISSVVITLSTGITAATDANGVYTFTNVLPGTYTLTETNPSGYTSTGDIQGTNDDRITLTVTSGVNVTGQDFFDAQFANITGAVYDDLNGNGVHDPGEPGISGVVILLSNGTTTTTNTSGLYTFTVPVGSYTLTETNPSGYTSTGDTQGANDNLISVTVGTGGSSNNNFLDARPVTITGHVYNDLNGNGAFNGGELGIANVVITLSTGITAATDANGVYTFTNVMPGTYTLTETNPSGYSSTGDVQGANDDRITLSVTSGNNVTGQDFFDTQFAGITGAVYEDLNGNGVHDPGEPGIAGVLILLSNGTTTTTNASGVYTFTNLTPGTYTITETNPSGYTSTGDTQGANDDVISVTLGTGGSSNNNFLDAQPVTIIGHVYQDLNGNGSFNSGEMGIPNVVLTLNNGATTSTDANGVYTFTVMPGTYTITETNPSGYTSTGDTQGGNDDRIIGLTVTSGATNSSNDFFDALPITIGDSVWLDLDQDGILDVGEPGLQGVTVTLQTPSGVLATTTDSNGHYTFTSVISGSYLITFTALPGYQFSPVYNSNTISTTGTITDSNANPATGATGTILLAAGVQNTSIDAGLILPVDLGVVKAVTPVTYTENSSTAVTYQFTVTNVGPGDVINALVTDTAPANITFNSWSCAVVTAGSGLVTNQCAVSSGSGNIANTVTLRSGAQARYTITATVSSGASTAVTNTVTTALPGSFVQSALSSQPNQATAVINPVRIADLSVVKAVTPAVYTAGGTSNVTYVITVTNHGPSDVSAAPVTDTVPANLTFTGWNCAIVTSGAGNVTNACASASGSGNIATNVTLRSGAQARFTVTATVDSAARNPITNTATVALPPGVIQDSTVRPDTGSATLQPARVLSLGSRVWYDANDNGTLDGGEPGIQGVVLQLLNSDSSPYLDNGQPVTATSDSNGYYTFTQLLPGNYRLQVINTNFANNAPLAGLHSSVDLPTSANADNNIDNDDNGVGNLSGVTTSGVFTITVGGEPINETDELTANANSNLTLDFGFYEPLSLGNRVWLDLDNDGQLDSGENGINSVVVNLYLDSNHDGLPDGGVVMSDTTSGGGYYFFDNLTQGGYQVEIAASNFNVGGALAGYYSSLPTALNPNIGGAGNLGIDNDDNGLNSFVSGAIRSASITLTVSSEPTGESDLGSDGSGLASDGSSNLSIDFGFFRPVQIGDRVWYDYDADGLQGVSGEPGVPGVQVKLFTISNTTALDIFGNPVGVQTTDSSGVYTFSNLQPGNYTLVFVTTTVPANYVVTQANAGDETLDSDADTVTGQTRATGFLSSGQQDGDLAMGIHAFVSVGGYAWFDYNHNGQQDAGVEASSGVSDVRVNLYYALTNQPVLDTNNQPVHTYSNNSGLYSFGQLLPGRYYVQFDLDTLPTGYTVTLQNVNSAIPAADLIDSDADPTTGNSDDTAYLLGNENPSNNQDMNLDLGIYGLVNVGGSAWIDADGDGVYEPTGNNPASSSDDEAKMPNIGVTLYQVGNANPISTTTTDSNGDYLFRDQIPGDYYVVFNLNSLPAGYVATVQDTPSDDQLDSDANRTTGQTASTGFLSNGDQNQSLDLGIYKPVVVDGRAWLDSNGNGVRDSNEVTGTANVTVTLYQVGNGTPLNTTHTNASGVYSFTNLPPGDYYVVFGTNSLPPGYQITTQNVPGDNTVDSDASSTTGQTESTGFLYSGQQPSSLDMGLWQPVKVGTYVWQDSNRNGIQDAGEVGANNVMVRLYQNGSNTALFTGTTASGHYTFSNLPPADYYVVFDLTTLPTNTVVSPPNANDPLSDTVDSDANLSTGQTAPTGLILSGGTNSTLAMGIMPLADIRIGDSVWHDINANGIQETGEGGIENVVVRLYQVGSNQVISSDVTDLNGQYLFDNLPPGNYYLVFDLTTLPAGYEVSPLHVNAPVSDTVNSDADPTSGQTQPTGTLNSNQQSLNLDMGIYQPAALGDSVWNDVNANGIHEAGENGIQNVLVKLYKDGVDTGLTRTTGPDGSYLFTDLVPGNYFVEVVVPSGYRISPQDVGNNNPLSDTVDSDIAPANGRSASTTLTSGKDERNTDAGLYIPLSLGSSIWFDVNNDSLRQASEVGLANVLIELYDAYNHLVMTTTSDANGFYLFNDLVAGDYTIVIPGSNFAAGKALYRLLSSSQTASDPNIGGPQNKGMDGDDNGIDSAQPLTDGIRSGTINLSVGGEPTGETPLGPKGNGYAADNGSNQTIDFAFYEPLSLGSQIWNDIDHDGIQDGSELGIEGVALSLYRDADHNGLPDGAAIATQVTISGGWYLFDNLAAGSYLVVIDAGNFLNSGVLSNTVSSKPTASDPNVGGSGNKGIVGDDNGLNLTNPMAEGIRSGSIDLYPSSESTGEPVGPQATGIADDDSSNLTVGFGFYEPLSLGNRVWVDSNNNGMRNNSKSGMDGVLVNLYQDANNDQAPDGGILLTDTTSNGGYYLFDDLQAGGYLVEIAQSNFSGDGKLVGYYSSLLSVTSANASDINDLNVDDDDDGIDSAQPAIVAVRSNTVQLSVSDEPINESDLESGVNSGSASDASANLTVDFGFFKPVLIGDKVWYDNDADGKQEALDGELGVPNVTVALFTSAGNPVTDIFGNPIAPTQTDASGHYTFTDLPPGDYYVQFNLATLPSGFVVTTSNAAGVSDTLDSDGSPLDGKTHNTGFLSSGTQEQSLALGIYQPLSVGNSVWADNNRDGIYQPGLGEPGVSGVVVTLYDNATGLPIPNPLNTSEPYTQVSDSNGHYLFTGLQPGDYYLVYDLATLPAGYAVTKPNQGNDDSLDSDVDPVSGKSDPTGMLTSGHVNLSIDLGVYTQVGVGDRVWYDDNHDGQQQPGEGGVPNIRVTLYSKATNAPAMDLSGNLLMTFTKSDGSYLFSNMAPGNYYAVFDLTTLPAGYQVTLPNVGSNLNDSDVDPVTGATSVYSLDNAQINLSVDMGIWKPISIGDRVWLDNNFNGLQDAGEPGLAHVSVSLLDAKGAQTGMTTQTDANGYYTFSNLLPGDYKLVFDLATLPAGYKPTTANVGSDDGKDSDADPNSGATPSTGFINSNQQVTNLDMGVIGPVSVGSLVWDDQDRNGIQDLGEPGVTSVQVSIFNADGTPAKDMNGNLVSSQLTNGSGHYSFTNLLPGSYYVQFDLTTLPATYQVTKPNMGANDTIDSDASPSNGQTGTTSFLTPGSSDATLAMGIHQPLGVRVGDSVWDDANGNGLQDAGESGVSGIVVELYVLDNNGLGVSTGFTQSTDIDGFYLFDELPPGEYYIVYHLDSLPAGYQVTAPNQGDDSRDSDVDPLTGQSSTTGPLASGSQNLTLDMGVYSAASIGDRVWSDVNGNGAQDAGEIGVANVVVTLYHADGTPTGFSTTTDSTGNFIFEQLAPGRYILEVTPPAGYAVSLPNLTSDDGLDSDFDPNTHRTPIITVNGGEINDTIDAGLYLLGAIGSTVWEDKNANGIRESNEPLLANITVKLHDSQGNLIATTQTNGDGHYGFTGLSAGDFTIEVVLPSNYAATKANQGSDDSLDSDILPGSLMTSIISLQAGESEFTWDAGLFHPAVLGNTIWIDRDANGLMDEDEPGVAGIVVELYEVVNGAQTLIMTTTTDIQGNYQFTNLPPGNYVLQVVAPPNSQFTQPDQSGGFNSDVDPATGQTPVITLGYGEVNLNVGAGILPPTADEGTDEPDAPKRLFLPLVQR
ncbi:MAG: SdrD B-like domain-containing protein [Caldilineaceae bacterium]